MTASFKLRGALAGVLSLGLIAGGAVLRAFPKSMLDAAYKVTQDVYRELGAKSADFKKVHDHYFAFQREQIPWFRVNENSFDDFMASAVTPARAAPAKK
ncbi:MAG: hypothetical protein J0H64_03330 [Actinobacteria bacterium]|nr:hypothetical protein [Actinomycetota bacterium]